jgi:hypothetical protein
MDGDVDSSTRFVILDALEQIVKHYSQSIHEFQEQPPYFYSLLGYSPKVPPVVKFLLDQLMHQSSGGSIIEWVLFTYLFPSLVCCNIVIPSLLWILNQISTVVSISNAKARF